MSKVLYRKYRPTKLSEVVGQDQVTAPLQQSLKQDKINHAYLFIGPRGTGKTSVARIFAHAVNGFSYELEDNYLDIIEIDAASNTGVDNIRDLRESAIAAPTQGKYKVYIIDEVHMLSKSAANALLKTLEEPPLHVIFILATTEANKVPITISSRTQLFTFRLADPEIMLKHLQKIAKDEKIPITEDALRLVVRRGGGSFRDSLSLLDQVSALSDKKITEEVLANALGLPQEQSLTTLLNAYASGDTSTITNLLRDLLNTGLSPETLASELLQAIISNPTPDFYPLLAKLPTIQPPFPEAKLLLALLDTAQSKNRTNPPSNPTFVRFSSTTPPEQPQAVSQPTGDADAAPETDKAVLSVVPATPFSWDTFQSAIQEASGAVFAQLQKCTHECEGGTLHLYPSTKFAKQFLQQASHAQILASHLHGQALLIHDPSDRKKPKDATLSQISAIMGDVQEVSGDSPF